MGIFVQNKYLSNVSNNDVRTPFIDVVIKSLFHTLVKYLSLYYTKMTKYLWNCCFIAILYQSVIGYIYIYINLPVSDIVRLPHPWSGDSQGQEMFLAPSADKQTCNYDTECSNHHPSLSTLN